LGMVGFCTDTGKQHRRNFFLTLWLIRLRGTRLISGSNLFYVTLTVNLSSANNRLQSQCSHDCLPNSMSRISITWSLLCMLLVAATTFPFLKYTVNGNPMKDAHLGKFLIKSAAGMSKSWSRNVTCGYVCSNSSITL